MTSPTTSTTLHRLKAALDARLPRLWLCSLITLALAAGLLLVDHTRVVDILIKLSTLTMTAVAMYYLDVALFPYARPHLYLRPGDASVSNRPTLADLPPADPGSKLTTLSNLADPAGLDPAAVFLAAVAMLRRALVVGAGLIAAALVF
ncbi:MAG: hypothetical protein JNM52_11045 [Betaproteobacteria bacterium]|nr:hypothetical protein [Betaproteobacteria bacterium]